MIEKSSCYLKNTIDIIKDERQMLRLTDDLGG